MSNLQPQKTYLKMEALAAVREGDVDPGIQLYRQFLTLNPQDDDAWASLGGAYRRKDDIDQALTSYEKAYHTNPHSTYALVNMVSLLAARNTPEDKEKLKTHLPRAIELSRKTIDEGKGSHWTWYDLATVQLLQGLLEPDKSDEALKTFYYAVELTPETAKENFRSVLSNLTFLQKHNPSIPQLDKAIETINERLD